MTRLHHILFAMLALACSALATGAGAGAKSFEPPYLAKEAARYQSQITRDMATGDRDAAAWIADGVAAVRKQDWRGAYAAFGAAIAADPDSEQAWRNHAIALLRIDPQGSETYEFPQRAKAAAFRAYQLSKDAKAEARALAILAEAYMRAEDYRPALNAYKESLRLNDHADVRAAYMEAREEHGFRVVDNEVDADTASPRACLRFSEQLARGRVDYAPFVSVLGMDRPAVTAEGDKICVDGLKHGETYEITVRAGVPSNVAEDSLRPSTTTVYVRDRKPEVRFTGRNYVLPRTGQQGLPFVSVNVDRVAVEIYRVGERGMGPEITDGKFQRQLDGSEVANLKSDSGAQVFAGEVEVARKLNEEVATAVPLDETVKTLEPGVYVMIARPADAPENEDWDTRPTQWFVVSDIGLTALSAGDGVHVFARSLAGAAPLAGVDLTLLARNNDVLARAKTDANGYVRFEAGLTKGEGGLAPAVLTAAAGGDYGFLALTAAGFDLSDRGVEGRTAPGPLDALVYTERGVYRPGETVHVTTLLRDQAGAAVETMPLTLVFERPDGAEERRQTLADAGAGGRAIDLPLVTDATTGTWRVKVYAETRQPPIGQASFLVEDYVPERLDLTIAASAPEFGPNGLAIDVDGSWLYGAPAADLAVEGDVTLRASGADIAGLTGYRFGLADEELAPVRTELPDLARTDAAGKAHVQIARPALPATSKPLEADIAIRLREPGGRTIERTITKPVTAAGPRIGVKTLFDGRIGEGETANFDVVAIAPDGTRLDTPGLRWELSKLNTRYQWYSEGASWNYEAVTTATREADGTVDVVAGAPARISARLGYGRYRLDVTSADPVGPATSLVFDAGWNVSAGNVETPDTLDIALDKPLYAPGDTARLRVDAPFDGTATIAVVGNDVIATQTLDVKKGGREIELKVTEAWHPGAYVLAFLHRPFDAGASRMPGRAVGVAHAQMDAKPRTLDVELQAPSTASPRGTLRIPVKIGNAGGETTHLVVAAVDVGILNLTGFKAPAPEKDAFAQRKLGAEVRDLYGQLIDGMKAARGRIRTGGDAMGDSGMGEPPTQQPLALFSGIVPVDADGNAEVAFDIPAFNGTVKLMAVAWSKTRLGHAEQDVVIADPVVVTAAVPRFLAVGDTSRLRLDLHNVSGPAGNYVLDVVGDSDALAYDDASRTLPLGEGQRTALDIALSAKTVGRSPIEIALTAPDGRVFSQVVNVPVRPAAPETTQRNVVQLAAKGGSITLGSDMLRDYVPGTGSVALSVGPSAAFEPAAFINALETYPYGCSEQLSSRLVAILYAEDFGVTLPDDTRSRAQEMIGRILARQASTGSFGLWTSGGDDLWLDAYVTDILTRAREKGYDVPERAAAMALTRLKNVLGYQGDVSGGKDASDAAYAHYVLARNGRPMIGDLRYLGDTKIGSIVSPLARAQIAAALALAGDQARAAKAFAAADEALSADGEDDAARLDYGTPLRDGAGVLALAAETSNAAIIPAVARKVDEARGARSMFSTQENAWLLRASQALKAESAKLALTVDGATHAGAYNRSFGAEALERGITLGNAGAAPAVATVTTRGAPLVMPPEAMEGLGIARAYYTLAGEEVDPSIVAQNTRLVVTLTVTEAERKAGRLLVVDRLPAGFEIDNPKIVTSAEVANLAWLDPEAAPVHSEFRDDRYVGAFERGEDADSAMIAAYIVRAVAPGRYVHPPATVEDMYRVNRLGRSGNGTVEVTGAP